MTSVKIVAALILLLHVSTCFCQTSSDFEIVPLNRSNTSFILSPYFSLTGRTRVVIPVELPANTAGWYYQVEVHTEKKENKTQHENTSEEPVFQNSINSLKKALSVKQELTKAAIQYITAPKGDGQCDVYLLDHYNSELFKSKADWTGGQEISAYAGEQMLSISQTQSVVLNTEEKLYLGLRNPSSEVIKVRVVMLAVIKKPSISEMNTTSIKVNGWDGISDLLTTSSIKSWATELVSKNESKLVENAQDTKSSICNCVLTRIQTSYKHKDFGFYETKKQREIVFEQFKTCIKPYSYQLTENEIKATKLGNIGWDYYTKGDYDNSIVFSRKAIQIEPLPFIQFNLALCYLAKGNDAEALFAYVEATELVSKRNHPNVKKLADLNAAIKDITDLQQKGSINGAEQALNLLRSERKKYML